MKEEIQYDIYIGSNDQQTNKTIVDIAQLKKLVDEYFSRLKISYSVSKVSGGYQYGNGIYEFNNTLCITIIGEQGLDIVRFAKGLSMYMNQECFLITKNKLMIQYG